MSFLERACRQAWERVRRGYYDVGWRQDAEPPSLVDNLTSRPALICEVKRSSPTMGRIRPDLRIGEALEEIRRGGGDAVSILTDPDNFQGSLRDLKHASESSSLPTLMKDFIVSERQIEAAWRSGASAILLIYPVFKRGLSSISLREAINTAHSLGLEVILEVFDGGLGEALDTDSDLVGVNSRNLDTLEVDLWRAYRMIKEYEGDAWRIVAESGIRSPHDVRTFMELGVSRFLVGTSIMSSRSISSKIRELKEGAT